ncbi:MAG TPA: hypothetical protein VIJ27_13075 [Mucilaginibacter sp.]
MKKLLILILALAAGYNAFAQQKSKTRYMNITIYSPSERHIDNMIVTRTDSAQKITDLKIILHPGSSSVKFLAQQDNALLQLLKPYYDKGWKLVSFTTYIYSFKFPSQMFYYYLSKDE